MIDKEIIDYAKSLQKKLIYIRRELHKIPEVALKEYETSKFIIKTLMEEGIEEIHSGFYETAVMAIIKGENKGETILLRADMDALKIEENTNVDYTSQNKGVMHACGHDAHITWMIGCAILLNKFKKYINGNIKIIFQPAEESTNGADSLLEKFNVITNEPKVSYSIAGHIWPNIESGKIGIVNGCAMAAANFMEITINGKGGHAATPDKTIDPISIGNLVYTAIQNLKSRVVSPINQSVITIGSFKGEGSFNIIPDKVTMEGTIRAESEEEIEFLCEKIEDILSGICTSFGAEYKFNQTRIIPPVINDKNLVEIAIKSGEKIFGYENVLSLNKGCMTGEDFSYYLKHSKGLFAYIGNKNIEKNTVYPLHNSRFNLDENILWKATAYFSRLSLDILNKHKV